MKLKSRDHFPPGGFQFCQPETGWCAPDWRSFDTVVRELMAHRIGNPHLIAQHNWSTDYDTVANQVDEYNAIRCLNGGYMDFITQERNLTVIPKTLRPKPLQLNSGAVAGALKRAKGGIKLVIDWLGQGAKSVPLPVAQARAEVCVQCPLNQDGNFWQRLEAASAEALRKTIEIKNDMQLRTSLDEQLKSCQACDCWLPLKVFIAGNQIEKHTPEHVWQRLHPKCWIFTETGRTPP